MPEPRPLPMWHLTTERAQIRKFCVGSWQNNVYVIACPQTGQAVIVDAADEPDAIVAAVSDVEPIAILTTHGHFDHVGAARPVADRLGIPFRLHPADADVFGLKPDELIEAGVMRIGNVSIEVIETPGHTPGSVCLSAAGVLLSGDTLFPGGPGATRGPGSDFSQIMNSLDRLFTLDEDTVVLPGHGLDTTIGSERPHATAWRARGW